MRRVGPGLYLTETNELHVDCPELLRHFGYADTPANRETVAQAALKAFREAYPGVPADVEYRDPHGQAHRVSAADYQRRD